MVTHTENKVVIFSPHLLLVLNSHLTKRTLLLSAALLRIC